MLWPINGHLSLFYVSRMVIYLSGGLRKYSFGLFVGSKGVYRWLSFSIREKEN